MSLPTVILGTLIGLLAIGIIYQTFVIRSKRQRFAPPGQMVELGNYRLHLHSQGDGSPTVILDAGMVSFSSNWAWVQPAIAQVTRVVAYDRAGLGWSDPGPKPNDAGQSARDLHNALQKMGIPGPYILIGHSYGGLVMRAFVALYRDETAGVVLVDGSHPDQWTRFPASRNGKTIAFGNRLLGTLARIGVTIPVNREMRMLADGLPVSASIRKL